MHRRPSRSSTTRCRRRSRRASGTRESGRFGRRSDLAARDGSVAGRRAVAATSSGAAPARRPPTAAAGTAVCTVTPTATGCVDSGREQRHDLRLLGLRDRRRRQPDAPERQRAAVDSRGARRRDRASRARSARPMSHLVWDAPAASGQQRRSRRISADQARRRHQAPTNPKDGTIVCPGLGFRGHRLLRPEPDDGPEGHVRDLRRATTCPNFSAPDAAHDHAELERRQEARPAKEGAHHARRRELTMTLGLAEGSATSASSASRSTTTARLRARRRARPIITGPRPARVVHAQGRADRLRQPVRDRPQRQLLARHPADRDARQAIGEQQKAHKHEEGPPRRATPRATKTGRPKRAGEEETVTRRRVAYVPRAARSAIQTTSPSAGSTMALGSCSPARDARERLALALAERQDQHEPGARRGRAASA